MTATVRNGIKPQYRALAVMEVGVPFTPADVDSAVGVEGYASKYVSLLRKDGFVFEVEKDGRRVATYTLTEEPENASELRNQKPKEKAEKPVKAPKPKKAKKEKTPTAKAATKKAKKAPVMTEEDLADEDYFVGNVGSIDDDFDELQGVDLKDLI